MSFEEDSKVIVVPGSPEFEELLALVVQQLRRSDCTIDQGDLVLQGELEATPFTVRANIITFTAQGHAIDPDGGDFPLYFEIVEHILALLDLTKVELIPNRGIRFQITIGTEPTELEDEAEDDDDEDWEADDDDDEDDDEDWEADDDDDRGNDLPLVLTIDIGIGSFETTGLNDND